MSSAHSEPLDAFRAKFDDLLDRMQTTAARKEMEAAFNADPAELGKAAAELSNAAHAPRGGEEATEQGE